MGAHVIGNEGWLASTDGTTAADFFQEDLSKTCQWAKW